MRNLTLKSLALTGAVGLMLAGGGLAASSSPAEAGASTGTWRYYNPGYGYRYAYPRYGYRRGWNGGAVAAGAAAGLALGAVGAAAASPYYGGGYYAPVYGGYAAPVYDGDCYWVRRRGWDAWGNPVIRRVQVCD